MNTKTMVSLVFGLALVGSAIAAPKTPCCDASKCTTICCKVACCDAPCCANAKSKTANAARLVMTLHHKLAGHAKKQGGSCCSMACCNNGSCCGSDCK